MTPYTIAHLKLGLLLKTLGYRFEDKERLNIFLTNSLDEGIKKSELLFSEYISQEANQAAAVKTQIPINVVIGNPPYAGHSANKGSWIDGLVKDYYKIDGLDLNEKNSKKIFVYSKPFADYYYPLNHKITQLLPPHK